MDIALSVSAHVISDLNESIRNRPGRVQGSGKPRPSSASRMGEEGCSRIGDSGGEKDEDMGSFPFPSSGEQSVVVRPMCESSANCESSSTAVNSTPLGLRVASKLMTRREATIAETVYNHA